MIIGSQIFNFETLTSTNSHAVDLAVSKNTENGTIIRAVFQSAGKGQPGNKWESDRGMNLLFSIILYPSGLKPMNQFVVSMALSIAIHDFLETEISCCKIKWPNDIYVKNDKIAGILIESSIMRNSVEYLVAGIGLNINQEEFRQAPNPTSMKLQTGRYYDVEQVLSGLIPCLEEQYSYVNPGNYKLINKKYVNNLYRFKEWSQYRDADGSFIGRILSVGNDGALTVEKKTGGKNKYYFKEIEFIL